ncbi:MAG: 5-oxoprolinase (ATP-hydrolyzing), partial [Kiritimatiellia bacterium]
WHDNIDIDNVIGNYEAEHQRRYGFLRASGELQVERIEVVALQPHTPHNPIHADPWDLGSEVAIGPTVIYAATTAIVVPIGWRGLRRNGLLVLEQLQPPDRAEPHHRTAEGVGLWSHRFMAVAEQAGAVLGRLARSVNIRERLDYSCAIFDSEGRLVANAPHIPVHLGAMGETVRDLLRSDVDLPPEQSWLCNDPSAGGSHLPDLTVVTSVYHDDHRFFVACRGHHVDVGGTTPGSMPPRSTRLSEEGLVFRRVPLLHEGALIDLSDLLVGARVPDVLMADLAAQIASNHRAASALRALGPADLIATWMAHLQDVAAESVEQALEHLTTGTAQDDLDGVALRLAMRRERGQLVLDWSGTSGPHVGNLNAPAAVVRAATLYSLRVLVDRDVPLNEGAMRNVRSIIPRPSVLNPQPDRAVAGGNVETSQRLVDLLLSAADRMAPSAGSMSNLTLGGDGWAFYETLPGGSGASPDRRGASARQAHMTNTRATDPEILERRCPLRVICSRVRAGSGGVGRRRGGDGLIRELEVLHTCTASLLAAWRPAGARGKYGGGDGQPGRAELRLRGDWRAWTGQSVTLRPGDRVRIYTPGGAGWGAAHLDALTSA